jgi:CRISPR-associated endoribonuclease Cas6
MEVPVDLNLVQLIVTLRLEADISDRYALFAMKPYFEEAFRQAAGCTGGSSGPCTRGDGCPYHQTFSQPLSADPAALRRYQKPSLPFVFHLPLVAEPPNEGDTVELGLILAGSAVNFATDYLAALEGMLRNPGFRRRFSASLIKVESAGYGGTRTLIMAPGKELATGLMTTLSLQGLRESSVLAPDAVTVTIVTPMRIMAEGRPLREFSFSPFIRALCRRASAMAYYYGGSEADLDFKWLAERSRSVACADADFRWVEWGSSWGGLLGSATVAGDMTEYHPFLLAGEYLHVGKGATFGLGRYALGKTL